ncbi:MAG: hypothetical protein AAF788_00085 [Pseudomonadota bacterium]
MSSCAASHNAEDHTVLNITQLTLSAALMTALLGTAHAGINDDINNCRAAIDDAGLMAGQEFSLRFIDDQGNRNRVLTLEAVVVGGEDQTIECRMSRSKVNEVVAA